MPLICLASSGASKSIQGGTVAQRNARGWRKKEREPKEKERDRTKGDHRETEEDGKRVFGRKGLPVASGLPLAAVNLLLLFFLSARSPRPPLKVLLSLFFLYSFSFITPKLSTARKSSLFFHRFLYFLLDLSFSLSFFLFL